MNARTMLAGVAFALVATAAAGASATELKVLSVEALKPALQELVPAFQKASSDTVKVQYATPAAIVKTSTTGDELNDYDIVITDKAEIDKLYKAAKVAGGSIKVLATHGSKQTYAAGAPMFGPNPAPGQTLINYLSSPKAASAYKTAGFEPPAPKKAD